MSDHSYYVRDSGAVDGPVSLSELRLKLMRGALSQDIEVLRDDESTWHAATILPELFDLFNNAGPQSTLPESPRAFRVRMKR